MSLVRKILYTCVAFALGSTLAVSSASHAQIANKDQVGIVVPAFQSTDGIGLQVAYAIKNGIQSKLVSVHPKTGGTAYGHAISYFVPEPMAAQTHEAALELAMYNGLQATLWGVAYSLADGVAVEPYLTISPPYEDYRTKAREIWNVTVGDTRFSLGPPRLAMSFAPVTLPSKVVEKYGNLSGMKHCRVDRSGCKFFSTYQVGRVFGFEGSRAILRRGGDDYWVDFPNSRILASEAINYGALLVAYFRGNFYQAIDIASQFIHDPKRASTSVRIDALLYRGAAWARVGDLNAAERDFAAARDLNPIAQRVFRYQLMGALARLGKGEAVEKRIRHLLAEYRTYYNPSGNFDNALITLFGQ